MSRSKRQKRVQKIEQRIEKYAHELTNCTPASEVWFQHKYKPYQDPDDDFNKPIFFRIPDVLNQRFKYIIEIDGSIHKKTKIQETDKHKDELFQKRGYKVIRVKAYCESSFLECLKKIADRKATVKTASDFPRKRQFVQKTVLRRSQADGSKKH